MNIDDDPKIPPPPGMDDGFVEDEDDPDDNEDDADDDALENDLDELNRSREEEEDEEEKKKKDKEKVEKSRHHGHGRDGQGTASTKDSDDKPSTVESEPQVAKVASVTVTTVDFGPRIQRHALDPFAEIKAIIAARPKVVPDDPRAHPRYKSTIAVVKKCFRKRVLIPSMRGTVQHYRNLSVSHTLMHDGEMVGSDVYAAIVADIDLLLAGGKI